ncbi:MULTISPECIES: hypothetical protein [Sediminibacillus]|uniref:hypothetical protein n=1 Tax=Sediminibacillus TaxID=482460 RepID=UPI001297085C|nr:hypothetical protein [Sediminibacillus terrae]
MENVIIIGLGIFISGYIASYAKRTFKEDNKPGGIALVVFSILCLAAPFSLLFQ